MSNKNPDPQVREQARAMAREVLEQSPSFHNASLEEQRAIYLSLVNENIDELSSPEELVTAMVQDFEDYDPGFDNSIDNFEDLVDSVDFPKFVGDLLKSVFDANMDVQKRQTDDYIRLLREATKTSADFIRKVNDEDAYAYLVESPNPQFGMVMNTNPDGSTQMELTTPEGDPVNMDDNEVKAKILEAKINMAKEHRAALREVILMGVSRIVVDKGEVDAAVEFTIDATRNSADTFSNTNTNVNTTSGEYSRGLLGSLFGGPKIKFENTNTNVRVKTSNQSANDNLTASLTGHVNIKFKSDFFKLDNFSQMYGDGGVAALQPAEGQGQNG